MRILTVSHYFDGHVGGIEIIAAKLCEAYAERGHEVTWAAMIEGAARRGRRDRGARFLDATGSNLVERLLGLPYPLLAPRSLRAIYRAARESDLVHVHDCLYMACAAAVCGARAGRVPVVLTQQVGLIPFRSRILRSILTALYRVLGRRVVSNASRVIFVSPHVQEYFEKLSPLKGRSEIVGNGIDPALFYPPSAGEREAARRALGLADGDVCLVFAGRFTEKKGIGKLRELCSLSPRFEFHFAGSGADDPAAWKLPNVTAHGALPQERLRELYLAGDLLLLPSAGEGAPLVVLEALACGLPCLVSPEVAGAFPEERALMLVCEPEARAMARCIEEAVQTEKLRGLWAAIATHPKDRWSWRVKAGRYLEIFEELIKDS